MVSFKERSEVGHQTHAEFVWGLVLAHHAFGTDRHQAHELLIRLLTVVIHEASIAGANAQYSLVGRSVNRGRGLTAG